MRLFIHVMPLALLFNLLLAESLYFTSPPILEASQESVAAISIPPIGVGCKHGDDFQCIGTSGGGKTKTICRCVGEKLYRHRTEKPEMKPASIACADTGFPITVEKGTQTTNSSHAGSPRPTTGWGVCLSSVPPLKMDNFTSKVQPTAYMYLQHPGSIGSNASHPPALKVPPKPIQSQIPAHDTVTTSSSTPLKGPLTAALVLVSTFAVLFALAA
ncbi:hypothetical protein M441DRAFT_336409 [Trichoderma asperellum CBS 433.97]|uniref:Extracellular membrane protein CFEM domain-containing protein n=1 Tax=Trichoderma asperellum (strain ATCC 204424 / CBS 433.97 / NBRC 101777) TaxID=1042311 RepID=A0A2T3ZGB4_TRIA4|nr:hypothetical protein M441DRAFT_336409 [Trichoderma asperellum CBS 433.97]PTB43823.1 hypothetical protein M441DRAFT_336409 [Trichoderma asperellum CBS 433.97]